VLPDELSPCTAPRGTLSGAVLAAPRAMSHTVQWVNVPLGASGSSMTSASDFVRVGTRVHVSCGDVFCPSHV
jgi:hypothetical protein